MSGIVKKATVVLLVLAGLYFMPLFVTDVADDQGMVWKAPFGVSFDKMTDNSVVFTSWRSAYALGRDAENAVHAYEEEGCYGNTYFYDEVHDVSIYGHGEESGFPGSVVYYYEPGNICSGWTLDDEIAWPFGDPDDAYTGLTKETALEQGWLVIEDGDCLNIPVYNDFSRMVKQGVFCYLRTVIFEGNTHRIVDIQLCEDGHFRVIRCDETSCEEEEYIRLNDFEEADGSKPVYVYQENSALAEPELLFTVK